MHEVLTAIAIRTNRQRDGEITRSRGRGSRVEDAPFEDGLRGQDKHYPNATKGDHPQVRSSNQQWEGRGATPIDRRNRTPTWPPQDEGNPERGMQMEQSGGSKNREDPSQDVEDQGSTKGRECRRRTNDGQTQMRKRIRKNMRANIKMASLNIQRRGAMSIFNREHKWNSISRIMNTNGISILAVQETHLNDEQTQEINEHMTNLVVYNSIDLDHLNANGVAFVVNKRLTNWRDVRTVEIVPGRAILLQILWHADHVIHILNVYVPNNRRENGKFWEGLNDKWCISPSRLPFPDVILGDFNMVEEAINRLPSHRDNEQTVERLGQLISDFRLIDGWRDSYPRRKGYMFLQKGTGMESRIDRIYAT